jgi:hypothetical protein
MTESVSVYFKQVFTTKTMTCNVPADITIREFIKFGKRIAQQDFNLLNVEVEIVEAGKNTPTRKAEDADALLPEYENQTIREKYGIGSGSGSGSGTISFYIRERERERPCSNECVCVICHDVVGDGVGVGVNRYGYGCSQQLCENCVVQCRRHNLNRCPICRGCRL